MPFAEAAPHQDTVALPTFPTSAGRGGAAGQSLLSHLGSGFLLIPGSQLAGLAPMAATVAHLGLRSRHSPAPAWVAGETGWFIYHRGCDKECERRGGAHGVQCA